MTLQGYTPRGKSTDCGAQGSKRRALDPDCESKTRCSCLCFRNYIVRRAIRGVILAISLISCRFELVEGAIDLAVETPSPRGRFDSLNQSRPPLRSVLQHPHKSLEQFLISGAVFAKAMASPSDLVTMSGWFHIIWNGAPRYRLVDDEGEWADLLIDERVLRDVGRPRAMDRKRVRITGRRSGTGAKTIQVITINPDEGGER